MGRKQRERKRRKEGDNLERTIRRRAEGRLNEDDKKARIRARYGPAMKPAPVTVRKMETGDIVQVVDQGKLTRGVEAYSDRLDQAARDAGYGSYRAYLESDHWQEMRRAALERDRHRCVLCGRKEQLGVHHDRYTAIGNERLKWLKTMCWPCHAQTHRLHRN